MRVLITGGAGFIGSNLARALSGAGHDVVVADNLSSAPSASALTGCRAAFCYCDVRSPEDLGRLPEGPWDRVYHLAASFANALSVEAPRLDLRTNAEGTLNVIDFARRAGCGLFVYAGSSSSYGDVPVPHREIAPIAPGTPYALSKRMGEIFVEGSGLPFSVFRLFNVYGPGDPPGRYRNAIPNMMAALDRPDARIELYGDRATRDFTFVSDAVEVLCEPERARGRLVNVGTGVETQVVALAHSILALFGESEIKLRALPPRPWDKVARRVASVELLRSLYPGACSTPLERGLSATARWLHGAGHLSRGPS
jgi:nucleoside-diphosphate-sugar epimerase